MKLQKAQRKHSAAEYAALFPAKPKALRKIAFGLRQLGATGDGSQPNLGKGNMPFTINEFELAERCNVSVRTLKRYLPLFETYGILEVKRWRYREIGPSPNTYRVFLSRSEIGSAW